MVDYGVFVVLPNGTSGLVHRRNLDIYEDDAVADFYHTGDGINVKVLSMQDGRVSLAEVAPIAAEENFNSA